VKDDSNHRVRLTRKIWVNVGMYNITDTVANEVDTGDSQYFSCIYCNATSGTKR
jgi:hypothetical protein